jgi:hypothetical protein
MKTLLLALLCFTVTGSDFREIAVAAELPRVVVGRQYWVDQENASLQRYTQRDYPTFRVVSDQWEGHYNIESIPEGEPHAIPKDVFHQFMERRWIADYDFVVKKKRDVELAAANIKKKATDARAAHIKLVTSKPWPSDVKTAILEKKVFIGMTAEQARLAWGKPQNINRSVYSFGVHEQWVYGSGNYLYFENDKLTSLQTSQ